MNVNRILRIDDNNPLNTVRTFLAAWWDQVHLDALLGPVEQPETGMIIPQVIEDPSGLAALNPYAPMMSCNLASLVEEFVTTHPSARLAVVLRPCEFRALVELQKRHRNSLAASVKANRLADCITIGVDCTGTLPLAEYQRRYEQNEAGEMLQEALVYGSDGNLYPRSVRQACQMCDWPAPLGADMILGSMGVLAHGMLVVIARDEFTDAHLCLDQVLPNEADEEWVVLREAQVGKLADQHTEQREKLAASAFGTRGEINSLLGFFARCTLCADCLDACPIYDGEFTGMLGVGEAVSSGNPLLAELVGVSRWLASCSGCGMCQEACENGPALGQVITTISHRIRSDLHYTAGDPRQKLPWFN